MSTRISDFRMHIAVFFLACVSVLCLHAVFTHASVRAAGTTTDKQVPAGTTTQPDEFFLLDLYDTPLKTLDIDRDSRKIKQVKVFINLGYTLPSPAELSLSRPGHYFAGWMTKEDFLRNDGKVTYRPGDIVREALKTGLYAYWKKTPNRIFNYLFDHEDRHMKRRIEEKRTAEPHLVFGKLGELDASITDQIPKIKFKTPLSFNVDGKKKPHRHVIEKWTCKEVPGWSYNGSELTSEQIKTVIERYKASDHSLDRIEKEEIDGKWVFRYIPTNFTFIAHFKFLYRTITFDLNYDGAENRIMAVRKGINGDRFVVKERPEKPRFGYRFMGWSPDPKVAKRLIHGEPYDFPENHKERSTINPELWPDLNGFSFLGADTNVFTPTSDTTLYAIWVPKGNAKFTYAVDNEAGGYVTRKEETVPADGDREPLGSTAVAKKGWTFAGWSQPRYRPGVFRHDKETLDTNTLRLERCGHASGTRDQSLKSHISRHFVAHFVKIKYYDIAFSSNVSAGESASVVVPKPARVMARQRFQIPHDIPRRSGYQFTDWDTHPDGGGASYRPGDVIDAVSRSITLYAQWVKDTDAKLSYSVNNSKRGKVTSPKEIITADKNYPSGATARPLGNSKFKEWGCNLDPNWKSTNPVLTKEAIDSVAKRNNQYATAFFTAYFEPAVYMLAFDMGGATSVKALDTLFVEPGKTVSIPKKTPSDPGRIFVNWNERIDGKGASYRPGDMITLKEDTTLYAQWTKSEKTKFIYKVNDETKGYVTRSDELAPEGGGSLRGSRAVPLGDGYVFKWWECNVSSTWRSNNPSLSKEQIDEVVKDKTGAYRTVIFTAHFESKNYKVAFKSNVDTTERERIRVPKQGLVKHNEDFTLPTEVPVRAGYKFTFWSTKSDGTGVLYKPGAIIKNVTHNITLYALWERSVYEAVFDYGNGKPETYRLLFGSEFTLPSPSRIPLGKTFKGIRVGDKDGELKQPGEKIPVAQDIDLLYEFVASEKTVKITYELSNKDGGVLSSAEEMIAPNDDDVPSGTTITLNDGWKLLGWQIKDTDFRLGEKTGPTLTHKVIDRFAKENGLYKDTTFIALVERTTVTVTIKEPGQPDQKTEVLKGDEFILPSPSRIPLGKTFKGIRVGGKDGELKQPGEKLPVAQDIDLLYEFVASEKTVKITYELSNKDGGVLSSAEEMIAPNAETVKGTTLRLNSGWQSAGWKVKGSPLHWDKNADLVLTCEMIDRAAKENGLYKDTTFIALVERTTVTVTIKEPGQPDQKTEVLKGDEFILPSPSRIPLGKTFKGIRVGDKDGELKQPGEKIPVAQDIDLLYEFVASEKTVKITYELSNKDGGVLSSAEEMIAPNAETVKGTTLRLNSGWQSAGWKVKGSPLHWDKNADLVLTCEMIDRAAKENGLYKDTTFIALVERTTVTVTIKEPGQPDQKTEVLKGDEFILPSPSRIPLGKTFKGIRVGGKDGELKQPGEKIPVAQDIDLLYEFVASEKTVKITYELSNKDGGVLSSAEEMIAPNDDDVPSGTTITLNDGWKLLGWQIKDTDFRLGEKTGPTLTHKVIDRFAKENGLYKDTTFIALVERTTVTVTIKEPGQPDQKTEVLKGDEFILPSPSRIPLGKTFKGIRVGGKDGELKQPGEKIPVAQGAIAERVFDNSEGSAAHTSKISLHKRDLSKVKNGWYKHDNKVYYYKNHEKLTGWQELSGTIQDPTSLKKHWFYFDADGVMLTGRHRLVGGIENAEGVQEEHWFCFDAATGTGIRGWNSVTENGVEKWYYYGKDGAGYLGRHWVLGGFKNAEGLHEMNWFYFDRTTGVEIRGWHEIMEDGVVHWYHYREGDGIMLKGQHKLVGGFNQQINWFYFNEITGIKICGWKEIPSQNKWCYYGDDGAMLKGQYQLIGGYNQGLHWFYFDEETGAEIRGWKEIVSQNKWCYYGNDGAMLKGQYQLIGGYNQGLHWFYFDEETGAEIRGWKEIPSQNKWCYYGDDGAMLKGQYQLIGGYNQGLHWFYFDEETGAEIRGWKEIPSQNKWCYYGDDGAMLKGQYQLIGGYNQGLHWFYFDEKTGAEIRGWKHISGQNKTCYYGQDGAMCKGWHMVGGKIYYFDRETGAQY